MRSLWWFCTSVCGCVFSAVNCPVSAKVEVVPLRIRRAGHWTSIGSQSTGPTTTGNEGRGEERHRSPSSLLGPVPRDVVHYGQHDDPDIPLPSHHGHVRSSRQLSWWAAASAQVGGTGFRGGAPAHYLEEAQPVSPTSSSAAEPVPTSIQPSAQDGFELQCLFGR